jgi:hypothetical protein
VIMATALLAVESVSAAPRTDSGLVTGSLSAKLSDPAESKKLVLFGIGLLALGMLRRRSPTRKRSTDERAG